MSYGELHGLTLPFGRITPSEVQAAARYTPISRSPLGFDQTDTLDLSGQRGRRKIPRLVGYTPSEEMINSANHSNSRFGLSTVYCAAFSPDLKKCVCNIHGDQIAVRSSICDLDTTDTLQHSHSTIKGESNSLAVQKLPEINQTNKRERTSSCTSYAPVTLITVASFEDYQAGTLDQMLESWCGPKVLGTEFIH